MAERLRRKARLQIRGPRCEGAGVMTDEEMADFLGFPKNEPKRLLAVQSLPPEKRALFERMAVVEVEANLWTAGLGPRPEGVLLDFAPEHVRRPRRGSLAALAKSEARDAEKEQG
jgi:hypothetical protein